MTQIAGGIPVLDGSSLAKRENAVKAAMVGNSDAVALRVLDKLVESCAGRIMQAAHNSNGRKPDLAELDALASHLAKATYVLVDHFLGERESYVQGMMKAMTEGQGAVEATKDAEGQA